MKNKYNYAALLLILLLSACSPRAGHRILAFFFDGVPDPAAPTAVADTASKAGPGNGQLTASAPAVFIHSPFRNRNCAGCHGANENAAALKPQLASCYGCHDDYKTIFAFVHGPVEGGFCTACHAPHKHENVYLLLRTGQALCLYCHEESQVRAVRAHKGQEANDCMQCHDPHGGANRYVLK